MLIILPIMLCCNAQIIYLFCSILCSRIRIVLSLLSLFISRLTVVSCEAKKKQHACASSGPRDNYSELFTWMAALKF